MKIDSMYESCPHCGAPAIKKNQPNIEEERKLIIKRIEEVPVEERGNLLVQIEIERIFKRGLECYANGKAWLAVKNRERARKDFQRALKYFNQVLKIDSTNNEAREYRAKTARKIS
jgi:tetratricopeptide (TPR) repeat protein